MTGTTRPPDFEGYLYPYEHEGASFAPKRVRLWLADAEPAAEEEWHAFLYIEGVEGFDPPKRVCGGSAFQATSIAFEVMHRIAAENDGFAA